MALPFCWTWVRYQLLHLHIKRSHLVISAQTREKWKYYSNTSFFLLHEFYQCRANGKKYVLRVYWRHYLHSHAPKKQACFPDHKVFSLKKITDQILSQTTSFFYKIFFFNSVRIATFFNIQLFYAFDFLLILFYCKLKNYYFQDIIWQILSGVDFLHSHRIVHR